ncbi:DUF3854 domain-containing protein [bacterium]|nr:DUF3854 domain-containing protein [bacterium]
MTATISPSRWAEVATCPICGHDKYCSVSEDGDRVCCRRNADPATDPSFEFSTHKQDKNGDAFALWARKGTQKPKLELQSPIYHHRQYSGERAKPEILDRVYSRYLSSCDIADREFYLPRGLEIGDILRLRYREHSRKRIAVIRNLIREGLECHLPNVPGFYVKEENIDVPCWSIKGSSGTLIPCRNEVGQVVALKVRDPLATKDKYKSISSSKVEWIDAQGNKRTGPGAGSNIHFPLFELSNGSRDIIRITEGEPKADIATIKSGIWTIGIPGVGAWQRGVKTLLERCPEWGTKQVLIAFDADTPTNKRVRSPFLRLVRGLKEGVAKLPIEQQFTFAAEVWPEDAGKGIDDVLAAGKADQVMQITGGDLEAFCESLEALSDNSATVPQDGKSSANLDITKPNEDVDDPHRLARIVLESRFTHPEGRALVFHRSEWHHWLNASYSVIPANEIRSVVSSVAKDEFDRSNLEEIRIFEPTEKYPDPPTTKKVTRSLTTNIADALASMTILPSTVEPPAWLGDDLPPFDLKRALVTPSRIVSLDGIACVSQLVSIPQTPLLFGGNLIGCDFDPDAPDPVEWKKFLQSSFGDDPDAIATLQMYIGYCLTADTSQQKILFIVGPKRSGKGTICRILTHLVGSANVAGPTLSSLTGPFGLWQLLGKSVGIISDARLSGRDNQAIVIERLLSISGEDYLTVDRKNLPPITTRLPTRLVLCTNELPRLQDSSGALTSRFIVLQMKNSFIGKEDLRLESKLKAELPGILNWAIKGWQYLQQLGHFIQPESGKEAVRELEDLGSPISAFVRECCEVRPGVTVSVNVLFEAWREWCKENGRDHAGTQQNFGKDLRAAVGGLTTKRLRDDDDRYRAYEGIKLNASFLIGPHWSAVLSIARTAREKRNEDQEVREYGN